MQTNSLGYWLQMKMNLKIYSTDNHQQQWADAMMNDALAISEGLRTSMYFIFLYLSHLVFYLLVYQYSNYQIVNHRPSWHIWSSRYWKTSKWRTLPCPMSTLIFLGDYLIKQQRMTGTICTIQQAILTSSLTKVWFNITDCTVIL
jgi:hypothetical protein